MRSILALLLCAGAVLAQAAQLPEDRADALWHAYDGGGLTVQGPSLLVRKGFADTVSVWGNVYVDMISSASIDVVSTASPYSEERREASAGLDWVHDRTTAGIGYTRSEEDDYTANAVHLSLSQDVFGDLTTIGINWSRGWDMVRRNGDSTFAEDALRQGWRLDLTQVVTRRLLVAFNVETISDEGFLNNPYRQVRFLDPTSATGMGWQREVYPRTRTSTAGSARAMLHMPWRGVLKGEYRRFSDSWGIDAQNAELAYSHALGDAWVLDARYRWYSQGAADFYSDLFARRSAQNVMARDKELASFTSHTIGFGLEYGRDLDGVAVVERGQLNLTVDHLRFAYDNFRDPTAAAAPGEEPLYRFGAWVVAASVSVWF